MTSVSIIIPNWNGIKFIEICLNSVLASDFDSFEVIVVDNGSTDGSREIVEKQYPSIRLVRLMRNLGFARACNEGIHCAEGECIVLLNNDVEVKTDWLRQLVEGMERHPECGMGTSKMIQYDNHKQLYNTGDLFRIWCTGGGRGFGEIDRAQYEDEEYVFGACAGAGIYRRSLFEKIGLFDEDFFIFSEDVDLNLRAQLRGARCVYFPNAIVYHWGTATVGFNSDRHVFLGFRNDLFVLSKNYSLKEFLTYFKRIWKHRLSTIHKLCFEGQGLPVFLAYLSFLYFLPGMLIKRIFLLGQRQQSIDAIKEVVR